MKVAIDRNTLKEIKDLTKYEFIYVFDKEPLEELVKLKMHCINKDYIDEVDINLTQYNISCLKKANINDKNWNVMPNKKDYKFAIIVPNYNNDHRRL